MVCRLGYGKWITHYLPLSCSLHWARHWPRWAVDQRQFGLADLNVEGCGFSEGHLGMNFICGYFKDLFGRWTLTERDRQTYKWITKEQHAGWHILPVTSHWNNLSAELRGSRIVTYFISMHTQEMFQMLNSCSTFVLPGDVIILNRM